MGWINEDHPEHEGHVVGLVRPEGVAAGSAIFRELGYPEKAKRTDIVRIQAACECGWRSPYLIPLRTMIPGTGADGNAGMFFPSYSPSSMLVAEEDEERCRQLWGEHVHAHDAELTAEES